MLSCDRRTLLRGQDPPQVLRSRKPDSGGVGIECLDDVIRHVSDEDIGHEDYDITRFGELAVVLAILPGSVRLFEAGPAGRQFGRDAQLVKGAHHRVLHQIANVLRIDIH